MVLCSSCSLHASSGHTLLQKDSNCKLYFSWLYFVRRILERKNVCFLEFLQSWLWGKMAPFYVTGCVLICFDNVVCDWRWVSLLNTSCYFAAEVMERKVTSWQIQCEVSDRLFFYLGQCFLCSDEVFCNPLLTVCFCVCTRPFPSEDTALNEDDVYRSLEELAE